MVNPCAFMTSFLENVNFDGTAKIAYDDSTTQEVAKMGKGKGPRIEIRRSGSSSTTTISLVYFDYRCYAGSRKVFPNHKLFEKKRVKVINLELNKYDMNEPYQLEYSSHSKSASIYRKTD
jgi:hypothetical protein